MPKTVVTLRNPENPALPGEARTFDHVGAIQGGGQNSMMTFFNSDEGVELEDGRMYGGPKAFFAIASDRVYSIETPEYDRPSEKAEPPVSLHLPSRMRGRPS